VGEFRVGVLGGTFDPIHMGHLTIAEEIMRKLGLSEVLFIPAGQPVFKQENDVSAAEHRLEMVLLATAANPYFNVSTIELERPGPSYSVDTVEELKAGLCGGSALYLIMGFDTLSELALWKDPERLLKMCHVVGVRRPGHTDIDLRSLESALPDAGGKVMIVDAPLVDVSASDIRRRVSQGLVIRHMVPVEVEEYIVEHNLYL
jgi:nicotinate-nucleotide adenylyltransferase